jgi:predicted nucleotidyltransferase
VTDEHFEAIKETLKSAARTLRDAGVPFLLGGGLAVWARGGPESDHDLDLMVRPEDAERALAALVDAGLEPQRPPENWLFKARDANGVVVDLIFEPASGPIGDGELERAQTLEVNAVEMQVMSLEDVLATKLLALSEQHLDYKSIVEVARSVREQVDWSAVRAHTGDSPYATAFFTLVEELGIVEPVSEAPVKAV